MTLQELLQSLNLTAEQIASVNTAVDGVINSKLAGKDSEIKKMQGDLQTALDDLKGYKGKERSEKIKSLFPKDANLELADDILALAKIADEDTDEIISQKLTDTISKREFLKMAKVTDPAGVKVTEKPATPAAPAAKKADSKVNQTAMSNL